MATLRRILGDRLTSGMLAALLAYVLVLQGVVSAFAQGVLAVPEPGSAIVICSLSKPGSQTEGADSNSPLERAAHQCCKALCQAAASYGGALPASDPGLPLCLRLEIQPRVAVEKTALKSGRSGLASEARGPPILTV